MGIPKELSAGDKVQFNWRAINELIREVRVHAGKIQTLESKQRAALDRSPDDHGFRVYVAPRNPSSLQASDWRTVRVRASTVNGEVPTDCDSDSKLESYIVIPESSDGYLIWLEAKGYGKGGLTRGSSLKVKHGDNPAENGWDDYPYQPVSHPLATTFDAFIPIACISTSNDTDKEITIKQFVPGSLTLSFAHPRLVSVGDEETPDFELEGEPCWFSPDNWHECDVEVVPPSEMSDSEESQTSESSSSSESPPLSESNSGFSGPPMSSVEEPSSKTAIVPYKPQRGRTQFIGLFCAEMPEARFEDMLVVKLGRRRSVRRKLDRRFVQVCEHGSIVVVSAAPSHPVAVGARIVKRELIVERGDAPRSTLHDLIVTVRVSGIRRGFAGKRFPKFTKEEMIRNNAFWARATKPRVLIRGRKP